MRAFLVTLFLIPQIAAAHPVTLAYMDFRPATDASPLLLTIAIHPHQALLVVGLSHDEESEEFGFADQIPLLQEQADIVGAYLQAHTAITAQGVSCTWEPTQVDIPDTELGALADGVSMTAPLTCEGSTDTLEITSTLFTDAFKDQQTIVRVETPEGYADRLLLDRETTQGMLYLSKTALADVLPPDASMAPAPAPVLLFAGWAILVIALITIATVAYRTNIASPKE